MKSFTYLGTALEMWKAQVRYYVRRVEDRLLAKDPDKPWDQQSLCNTSRGYHFFVLAIGSKRQQRNNAA